MKKRWIILIIAFIIGNIIAFLLKADWRDQIAWDVIIGTILLMFAAIFHGVK